MGARFYVIGPRPPHPDGRVFLAQYAVTQIRRLVNRRAQRVPVPKQATPGFSEIWTGQDLPNLTYEPDPQGDLAGVLNCFPDTPDQATGTFNSLSNQLKLDQHTRISIR
jgi:hypothetical protein